MINFPIEIFSIILSIVINWYYITGASEEKNTEGEKIFMYSPASFGARLAAFIIDFIVIAGLLFVVLCGNGKFKTASNVWQKNTWLASN